MRKLLLFFAMVCVSIGTWATITIQPESVYIGSSTTATTGYGIYGAKAGELAQLLSGDNSVSVKWNGATLNDLKSAEYIKVGDSQNPNVLKDEDLEALELLSGAKFLDIDGSTLADGADITNIKAGSAIEAVTLPNNLTKEQVNGAGAALKECNANFGSCLSLDAEMEEREITLYPYTLGGESYNYTGDVSALTDNGDGTYTYNVTSAERTLTDAEGYPQVTFQIPDLNWGQYTTSDGEIIVVDMGGWTKKQYKLSKIPVKIEGSAGSYYYTDPFTNTQVSVGDDSNFIFVNGVRSLVVDFSPNSKTYDFDQNNGAKYKYQYTNLAGETEYTDESTTPDADMKISLTCDETVTITPETKTITAPVEGGKSTAIAYVNKAGSLYKATSLDMNDCKEADGLVISGNINNGDIAVHSQDGIAVDPQAGMNDADAFENDAIPAFYLDNGSAQIKSIDMSDAVVADSRHLRVLDAYYTLETIIFPKDCERIPNYCCYTNGNSGLPFLKNVTFPENLKSIGDNAFRDTALETLVLPGTIQSVGDYAFYTCKQLENVEMESLEGKCTFGKYVFASSTVKHVTLSEGVDAIGEHMFDFCASLESVRIPTTAETIKTGAFAACASLHKLVIPEGVKLLEQSVFDGAGLTDIYVMATTEAKVPKIYGLGTNPFDGTVGTFTVKNILGNNTSPDKVKGTDYNETTPMETALSWYQEEFSDMNIGIGGNNCMIQLHYPENMASFYNGTANLPDGWLDNLNNLANRTLAEWEVAKAVDSGWLSTIYAYGSYEYDAENGTNMGGSSKTIGPTEGGLYWPNQQDYYIRLAAGYSSTGEPTAEAWRQIPLQGITDAEEIIYTKKYDDTWYTMAFPWDMDDNTLFSTFNQKCEIVEFMGAEVLPGENENEYNLIFHFDEVAKTRYMPEDHSAEYRRIVTEHTRSVVISANGQQTTKKYYTYEDINTGDWVYWPYHTGNDASAEEREMQKKYNSIMHMMVFAGHPYMIHPSIGAKAGQPKDCTIAGVKKVKPGEGIYERFATLADVAEDQKVEKVVSANEYGSTTKPEWTNPVTKKGGKYYFIGNINDAVVTDGVSDNGVQDMPTENGPVYFLGVKPNTVYPQYFRKAKGKGKGKWTQYSAIIVPDADAIDNVEGLDGMAVGSSSTGSAKGFDVAFGEWEVVDAEQMATVIDNAVVEGKEKNEPAKIKHLNVVYNIKGEVVRSNSTSVEGLPKGLYIVNGKKYMVK